MSVHGITLNQFMQKLRTKIGSYVKKKSDPWKIKYDL